MRPRHLAALTLSGLLLTTACGPSATERPEDAGASAAAPAAEPEPDPALFQETVLYVTAEGLAYREPDRTAEASMRLAVDDRFRILEERPGWYRVETEWQEVPAWVPAALVRTAVEAAPVHVVNERLSTKH